MLKHIRTHRLMPPHNSLEKTLEDLRSFYTDKYKEPYLGIPYLLNEDIRYWSKMSEDFKKQVAILNLSLSSRLEKKTTAIEMRQNGIPTIGDFSFQQPLIN